jgi:hypothetical protein
MMVIMQDVSNEIEYRISKIVVDMELNLGQSGG